MKLVELLDRISVLKQEQFADDPWSLEDDSQRGLYFCQPLSRDDIGCLSEDAKSFSRKALDVLSQCEAVGSLLSTSAAPETDTFSNAARESLHDRHTTARA